MGRQMYEIRRLLVNYFSLWGEREGNLQESPALLPLPPHMAWAPSPDSLQPESSLQFGDAEGDRREVKPSSMLLNAVAEPISAKEKAELTSCCSWLHQHGGGGWLQPASVIHTHTKLDEMEMGNILLSLEVPLPAYILFDGWQHPPFLLRKQFAFLQEQLLSLENV